MRPQRPRTGPVEGPEPGRSPAPSPAGGRGRRGGTRHTTAKGGRPQPAGNRPPPPGTRDRDRGRGPGPGPTPRPGERASDRAKAEADLRHTSHERLSGRDHRAALGRTRAPNGATPRGEDALSPTPTPGTDASREGHGRPGKRGAPGGRADPVRKSGPGEDEGPRARPRRRGRREKGGRRGRGRHGTPRAQPTAAGTHTRGSHRRQPPSGKAAPRGTRSGRPALGAPRGSPPTTAAVAAGPPAPSLPSHARHRPTPRHPPGSPPGPTRGATDPVPKARAGGRGHRANQWPAAAPPTRRCRVRSQTGPPTDVKPVSRSGRREDRRAAGGEEGTDGQGHPGARRGGGSGRNLRHGRATRKTRPRDPTATDTRAVPRRPAWDAGRPSAPTETRLASPGVPPPGAPKRPQPQARRRQHHHRARDSLVHPPARSRSGRPARPHRGTLSQGQAARPRATQTRSWAPVTTRHTGAGGEPTRGGGGHAPDGTPRARTPTARRPPRPNPLGRQGPARRDPPPTQKGEARATVGDEPRSATTAVAGGNPRSPPRTPSRGKGRRVLCERVATAALPSRRQRQRRQSGGSGTPRHASRIAREGFLTEGGSHSPTRQPPLLGPAEAPRDAWGREGACSTRKHTCVRPP